MLLQQAFSSLYPYLSFTEYCKHEHIIAIFNVNLNCITTRYVRAIWIESVLFNRRPRVCCCWPESTSCCPLLCHIQHLQKDLKISPLWTILLIMTILCLLTMFSVLVAVNTLYKSSDLHDITLGLQGRTRCWPLYKRRTVGAESVESVEDTVTAQLLLAHYNASFTLHLCISHSHLFLPLDCWSRTFYRPDEQRLLLFKVALISVSTFQPFASLKMCGNNRPFGIPFPPIPSHSHDLFPFHPIPGHWNSKTSIPFPFIPEKQFQFPPIPIWTRTVSVTQTVIH